MKKIILLPIVIVLTVISVFAWTWSDADFNNDGAVDIIDHSIFASWYPQGYGTCSVNNSWCNETDMNEDTVVDIVDYSIFAGYLGCYNGTNESKCYE